MLHSKVKVFHVTDDVVYPNPRTSAVSEFLAQDNIVVDAISTAASQGNALPHLYITILYKDTKEGL